MEQTELDSKENEEMTNAENDMPKHRTLSQKNEYHLPKETFLMVIHFCKQYPDWERELEVLSDSSKGISYDQERVQATNDSDPTSDLAVKRAAISRKKDMIDQVAKEVGGSLWEWLILGACYDHPYYYLAQRGIPCGKDLYYKIRRQFFFEIAKKV